MEEILAESTHIQRDRFHGQVKDRSVRPNQALWNHSDQLRLRYQMERFNVVGDGDSDLTRAPQLLQPGVNRIRGEFLCRDSDVGCFQKRRKVKLFATQAVTCAHDTYVAVRE
jgi:hypothetical protein